jgi:hypothetical protein
MSFCASCGRQRVGTARFCGGCGAEFSDLPDAGDQGQPPAEAAPHDPSTAPPDPFASWYQQKPPGSGNDAGSTWEPTQTVQTTPTQPAGYPPSGFTAANPFSAASPVTPPAPPFSPGPPARPPERGGRRGLFIAVAVIVVLAAGGGAYALASSLGKHSTAQPTVSASPSATSAPVSSAGASTSPSASPSPTLSLVAVAPGVTTGAAGTQVETLLSHYFHGINTHSYAEYASTLNPEQLAKQPQSEFESGYSSTTDSGMTLTGLSDSGNGGLTATVTFTSRQAPAQSADHSPCNAWTLNLYLVPQGTGYLIGPAPSGYQPTFSDC